MPVKSPRPGDLDPIETASRDEITALQLQRLQWSVRHTYDNVAPYRKRCEEAGVHPDDLKSLADLAKFPFMTKTDLRDNYPFGIFSQPVKDIKEIHVSSGTTGNPTVVGYSREDVDLWGEVMARTLCCAGAERGDMVQIAYGYGLFTGGLGCHYGSMKAGFTILPMSSGQTKRQLKLMTDFKPRIICCTPSYMLYMLDEAKEMGLDPRRSSWEVGVFGAEPWSESMRVDIEKYWNLLATDVYGLSEIIGPGVAQECKHKEGLHLWWDVFYPEIIDPATNEPVPDGEYGELVVTTLTKTGMPLLRYRTRDIVSLNHEPCKCGRTAPRISKIKGRTDDMIIVRGINVFPSQIEHVLLGIEGIEPHYQIIVDRKAGRLDDLEIDVEVQEKFFSDEIKVLKGLEAKITRELESVLGVSAKVRLVEPKTITRSEGKAKRVIDKRVM